MIRIFKSNGNGLHTVDAPVKGCWIHVVEPTVSERAWLVENNIPEDYINYSLDVDERARTERENGHILILLRVPFYAGAEMDIPYNTHPLGLVLTHDWIVTISGRETDVLAPFCNGLARDFTTAKAYRFVLRILLRNAEKYLSYLREINKTTEQIEDRLQLSTENRELMELLKYQKSLTYFTTALKTNELMMERLHRSGLFQTYPEDDDLLEDVRTENQQAIEMTNIAANILSQMMDAFASIISNNVNSVMKWLALLTIMLSLPTMIFSFYGMNVDLPFGEHDFSYLFALGVSLVVALGAGIIFWRRRWL